MSAATQTTQVYRVYIKATPQAIWDAITKPEWARKYGYQVPGEYELRPGGAYRGLATEEMKAMGSPDVAVDGEVIEVDPPHRLVQTWHARWEPVEGVTRLTYEINEVGNGVTALTVIHELDDAPNLAAMVGGQIEGAGGGWNEVLSGLKTLLETGEPLYGAPSEGTGQ
jgi:uncharacterized protein YndB with AHSA1/START domain